MEKLVFSISKQETTKKGKIKSFLNEIKCFSIGGWPLIGWLLFSMFPFVLGYILPFFKLTSFNFAKMQFIGLDNFKWLLTSQYTLFWIALKNSAIYLLSVPIGLCIALFVAVQLDKNYHGSTVFKVIMFIPSFVSIVAITIFWRFIFSGENGLINSILANFGVEPINFLKDKNWFMPSVLISLTWNASTNSLLFQAALQNVNKSIKEAALIDGASPTKIFWTVTFPAISPTTYYQFIMSLIGALQSFTSLQLMADGTTGVEYSALNMPYYIYLMGFSWTTSDGPGRSAAAGLLYSVLIIGLTILVFKTSKKWVSYDE